MAEKTPIEILFADDSLSELSEDFKTKASVIFENAVAEQVAEQKKVLEEEFGKKIEEERKKIEEELEEKIDSYLTYVAEEWMSENELAVENGIQVEIAENFLHGMKELFESSYVEVPESKVDVVAEMAEELEKKEKMLEEALDQNIALKKSITETKREMIIAECTEGLADTQVDKLKDLVAMVEYKDDDQFKERVESIVETYIKKADTKDDEKEKKGKEEENDDVNEDMDNYIKSITESIKVA
jgi:hypothetical protein